MKRKANATHSTGVVPWDEIVLKRDAQKKARITPHWKISLKLMMKMLHLQIQFVSGERGRKEREIA
jgi:hypothetical protein